MTKKSQKHGIPLSELFRGQQGTIRRKVPSPTRAAYTTKHAKFLYGPKNFSLLALLEHWPEIVGSEIAGHSLPLKVYHKQLIIIIKHPAYIFDLMGKNEIIKKAIFQKIPQLKRKIERLVFRTSPELFAFQQYEQADLTKKNVPKSLRWHPMSPEYRVQKALAQKIFSDMPEDYREIFISLFIQSKQKEKSNQESADIEIPDGPISHK